MEQYLTYPVNAPLQDRLAESILKTLIEEGPKTLANPQDYDARANVMCKWVNWCRSTPRLGNSHDWARIDSTAWFGSCSNSGCCTT
nr:iron-containing alcohol dehydrogenase [Nostoc sp. NMS8]